VRENRWPEGQLLLMGRIAVAFSQLEWVVFLSPKRLRDQKLGRYRNEWDQKKDLSVWCEQLKRDAQVLSGGQRAHLLNLVARLERANEKRNDLFHRTWVLPADTDALRDLIVEIRELRDGLNEFAWPQLGTAAREKLNDPLPALRARQPASGRGAA
jgi:hypothetical protein